MLAFHSREGSFLIVAAMARVVPQAAATHAGPFTETVLAIRFCGFTTVSWKLLVEIVWELHTEILWKSTFLLP